MYNVYNPYKKNKLKFTMAYLKYTLFMSEQLKFGQLKAVHFN